MPSNKVKAITVGAISDSDEEEAFHMVVSEEISLEECLEWAMTGGGTDLPVLCLAFSEDDASVIARLWNEDVNRRMH
jgi:predicted PolB exonuclease-like 3'-5' exonuclease